MNLIIRPSKPILLFILFFLQTTIALYSQQKDGGKFLPTINQSNNSFSRYYQISSNLSGRNAIGPNNQQFTYPVDSCFTYTYKFRIGDANGETLIKSTFTAADGTTYLAGQVVNAGFNKNGLFQQLDQSGNIILSKSIEQTGRSIIIQSIRQLQTGDFSLIGTSSLPNGTDKKIILAVVNIAGNIQWVKSLSLPGYDGVGICSTDFNGIGFCGSDDSTMVYGRVDFSGNLAWLKKLRLMESGAVVAMKNWFIAYSGMDSSRHVSMLLAINPVTGIIQWNDRFGGVAMNSDIIFSDLTLTNLRPRIVGLYSNGNAAYKLFRLTVNSSSNVEDMLSFNFPGVSFDTTASMAINPWAQVIAFLPNKTSPYVYSFNTINDAYPDTLIRWTKKFSGTGLNEVADVERAFDGGFFIAGNVQATPTTSQAYLLKTDSIGMLNNCGGESFEMHTASLYGTPYNVVTRTVTNPTVVLTGEMALSNNASIPNVYECKSLYCPPVPAEDSCLSGFCRRYRSASFCDLGIDMLVEAPDSITIIGLSRDNPVEPGTERAFFAKLNSNGKLLERKQVNLGNVTSFFKIMRLMDNNLLVLGSSSSTSPYSVNDTPYITISKFSPSFNLIWNKSFPIYGPYSAIYGVVESADGSLFLSYVEGSTFCTENSVLKLNSQGILQWVKDYKITNTCVLGGNGSMTQDNNSLYLINFDYGKPGTLLFKIDKNSGLPVWTKEYGIAGYDRPIITRDLSFLGNDLVVQGIATGSNGSLSKDVVMIIDTNGNIKKANYFQDNGYATGYKMTVTQNHELVFTTGSYITSSFARLDSNLNIVNSKRTFLQSSNTLMAREGPDGSIYNIGYFGYNDAYAVDICLKKYTPDGLLGSCYTDTVPLTTGTQNIVVTSVTAVPTANNVILYSLPYGETTYSLQQNLLLCKRLSECDTLGLIAPAGVCDTLNYTIASIRRAGCTARLNFTYDTAYVKEVSRTDSTITVKFMQSGSTKIKAKIYTGCQWIIDSVSVNISITHSALSLGPDTMICVGNSIALNAHQGYISYLWSNGAVDSVITVTAPGTYYVDVIDACGKASSDTVIIAQGPIIPVSIGPDRIKCNSDTLHLKAPTGFINYFWGPNYNINSTNTQQVIVQPAIDTIYFVKAEKTPGCFGYDTVRITVHTSLPINLGQDKSICKNDSVILSTGTGFSQYLWNTGGTLSQLVVYNTGDYSVRGTSAAGCNSYDTIHVNVWALPVVQLDKDSTLCKGSSRLLHAGTFISYLWQDGSILPSLSVNNPGKYFVTVTDINSCKGSDTVSITSLLPLPTLFLPSDTSICSYSSIVIQPVKSFANYLWNTGDISPSIPVSLAGIYWLQVKDNHQCVGKDSIVVSPKDCIKGLFIPNAFTPDNNGKNDNFKPIIGGIVKQYQFIIYNRYGQIVFKTNTINNGWNGTYGGIQQNAGTFIWVCSYQLEGETVKVERGTFLLLR